jgi:hypothetical protein
MPPNAIQAHKPETVCPRPGIYRPDRRRREIALSVGEKFPPCSHCNLAVNWTLIRPTH